MNIAWFANTDFQEGNAASSRIRYLSQGLKQNGNLINLFILRPIGFSSTGINRKNKGFFNGIYFNYLNGSATRSHSFFTRSFQYLISLVRSVAVLITHRKRFDIIFIYQPRFLFFGHLYILSKILKIPLILEITELEDSKPTHSFWQKIIKLTDKIDLHLLKHFCFHLVVISDHLKLHFSSYFPSEKITKIPILIDRNRFSKPVKRAPSYSIGYLGSFASKDGVTGIILSFKEALKTLPQLKLKLIGYNPYEKYFSDKIKENQLEGYVELSGQISYEDVNEWLTSCDLLILNRTNHPYSHYGFPTKLGEYLATGIPTICTRVGDIETYLEHSKHSYLIEPDDTSQLTNAIITRYQNYEAFNMMGMRGREIALSKFDYQHYIPVLQKIFESAVHSKK